MSLSSDAVALLDSRPSEPGKWPGGKAEQEGTPCTVPHIGAKRGELPDDLAKLDRKVLVQLAGSLAALLRVSWIAPAKQVLDRHGLIVTHPLAGLGDRELREAVAWGRRALNRQEERPSSRNVVVTHARDVRAGLSEERKQKKLRQSKDWKKSQEVLARKRLQGRARVLEGRISALRGIIGPLEAELVGIRLKLR